MANTKAVLIIGGSGFLGTHLALRLREGYKVFATYHKRPILIRGVTFLPFNVENRNWIKRVVYTARPDVIIYAAGSNSMEWAENFPREAERVHTGGAATTSAVLDILQHKFIYLSNCYTFDGTKGNYRETDAVLPSTSLGKAKLGGENFIRGKSLNHVIIRSSPVFGRGNGTNLSFLDRLRMSLDRGNRVELPKYELHSFAPVSGLVDLVERLVETGVKNKILHYGGLTKVSYYDFGKEFAQHFGYDPGLILPLRPDPKLKLVDSDDAHDYSLNSTQTTQLLKIKPFLLKEGLDLIEKQLVARA